MALKFLIVEDESDLLEFIALFLSNEFDAEFIKVANPLMALELLQKLKDDISCIISDFHMPKVNGDKIFETARVLNPQVPFILLTSDSKDQHQNILLKANTGYVSKPFTERQLNTEVQRLIKKEEPIQTEIKYIPIGIECLLLINKINSPLFIRLSDNKIVKVINEGAEFNKVDYEHYRQKKVSHLFVDRDQFTQLIENFKDTMLDNMLLAKLKKVDLNSIQVSSNIIEILTNTVKAFGFDKTVLELVNKNVAVIKNLSDNTPEINNLFKWHEAAEKEYSSHHSVLISCITTAFCREYSFKNRLASEILTMAAFFHDIALPSHIVKNEVQFIRAMKMNSPSNKEEIKLIKSHPMQAFQWLSKWETCPKEVLYIVLHHHELPNGDGFPNQLLAKDIDELTACFILSEEIVELYLHKKSKGLVLKHLKFLEREYAQIPFKPFFEIAMKWLKN